MTCLLEIYSADPLAGGLETAQKVNDVFIYTAGAAGIPYAHVTISNGKVASTAQFLGNELPRALTEAAALAQVKSGVYEPRLLEFHGPWLVLWLKSVAGGADYLYPVAETGPPEDRIARQVPSLTARTLYSVEEFLKAVRPELQAKRASLANPQP